ncbi:hypothetical protein [Aquimarina algiphila]|uniref:hypothetical protein n=1 Tax=Aquimarina algiphila TaxID=2047982 RepID=UPI002492D056|nr:hypothetical protein [Aquimarina algiphila]
MSGPKVVRIVTPEERRIIKQKWLTSLRSKIEDIKEYALKHGVLDEDLSMSLEETLQHYQSISEDDYSKIEREVPGQIQYLEKEKKNLVQKVVKQRASKWETYKNLKSTHNELRFLLQKKKIEFEDFKEPLVISEAEIEQYSQKTDGLYKTLKDVAFNEQKLTDEQIEIQKRLSAGNSLLSVKEWGSNLPKVLSRLKKLENTLKEMYVQGFSQDKTQEFIQRCNALNDKDVNYPLLIDSLIIEAAAFTKTQLELNDIKEALKNAIAQLETLALEIKFIKKWKELLKSDNLVKLQEALERATHLYKEESQKIIVETRRVAIKKALKSAGYEVNDSMETAWVENGRLVVKKAKNSLYGVEFMSPKNLSRIQARIVADENRKNERTPNLDKNQEEIWCDEFDEIKEILESEDLSIIIDKMQEPGAIKLKEVNLDDGYHQSSRSVRRGKQL